MQSAPPPSLHRWQVFLGGMCALGLTLGMARFAYTPMLPVMQREAGLGVVLAGWLATVNYLGYITGALLASWVESPVARYRLYGWGLALGVVSTAAMAWTTAPWLWLLARYVGGLSGAAGMLLGAGLVLGWLMRNGYRAELGVYFMGAGLSIVLTGVMALAFVPLHWSWQTQWLAYAGVGALLLSVSWLFRPGVPPAAAANHSSATPVSSQWMGRMLVMYFLAGVGFAVSATYTVAMVAHAAGRGAQGPLAWVLVGLFATAGAVIWDRVGRRWGQIRAIMVALSLQSLSVFLPAWSDSLGVMLAAAVLFGGTFSGIVATSLAVSGKLSPNNPGKAMARLTLAYGVAQVVAPASTAMVIAATGHYTWALIATGVMLLLGAAALWPLRASTVGAPLVSPPEPATSP
jgi:predicted MFS family arabinose efflux permease